MKINGYDFTIGADPEVFVKYQGQLASAYGLIPGTKDTPFPVKDGAVQVDGMALEFNISPASTQKQFEKNLTSVLSQMTKMVPGYEMFIEPVADFGLDMIKKQPEEASQLGCSPDFNAYTGKPNPAPAVNTPFRTASGHIHIGWRTDPVDPYETTHMEACVALVKALDLYVGTTLCVLDARYDPGKRRQSLYGRAGAFRPKSYGLEYRVPSNIWIKSAKTRAFVFGNTIEAIKATFANPEVGETKINNLTARQLIDEWDGKFTGQENGAGELIEGTANPYEIALGEIYEFNNVPSLSKYEAA